MSQIQPSTVADKAATAQAKLNAALHRVTALANSESERYERIRIAGIKLAHLRGIEAQPDEQEVLRGKIAVERVALDDERVQLAEIKAGISQLTADAAALARASEHAAQQSQTCEIEAARGAWRDAVSPILSIAERLRAALRTAGLSDTFPGDAELLTGNFKR